MRGRRARHAGSCPTRPSPIRSWRIDPISPPSNSDNHSLVTSSSCIRGDGSCRPRYLRHRDVPVPVPSEMDRLPPAVPCRGVPHDQPRSVAAPAPRRAQGVQRRGGRTVGAAAGVDRRTAGRTGLLARGRDVAARDRGGGLAAAADHRVQPLAGRTRRRQRGDRPRAGQRHDRARQSRLRPGGGRPAATAERRRGDHRHGPRLAGSAARRTHRRRPRPHRGPADRPRPTRAHSSRARSLRCISI